MNKYNQKNEARLKEENDAKKRQIEYNNAAIQELYELTQRRFLKQIAQICDKMTTDNQFPRLLILDLILVDETKSNGRDSRSSLNNRIKSAEKARSSPTKTEKISFCLKTLCEYEEGWHVNIQSPLLIENVEFSYYAYLARIMNILKYGNLSTELKIFLTKNNILNDIEEYMKDKINENNNSNIELEFNQSYMALRYNYAISQSLNIGDIQRCELKSGKILWLCQNHIEECDARVLKDSSVETNFNENINLKSTIINELDSIDINIV